MILKRTIKPGNVESVIECDEQSNKMLTAEMMLGDGTVWVGTCTSRGINGVILSDGFEPREIGSTPSEEDTRKTFKHGDIVIWIKSVESATVLRDAVDDVIKAIKEAVS